MALYDPPRKVDADVEAELLAAAWYIEEHGWCQHVGFDEDGRVCLMGALQRVIGPASANNWRIGKEALEALGFEIDDAQMTCRAAPAWNDEPGRTQAEVVDRLRRAARGEFLGG